MKLARGLLNYRSVNELTEQFKRLRTLQRKESLWVVAEDVWRGICMPDTIFRLKKAEASSGIEVPKEGNWPKPIY